MQKRQKNITEKRQKNITEKRQKKHYWNNCKMVWGRGSFFGSQQIISLFFWTAFNLYLSNFSWQTTDVRVGPEVVTDPAYLVTR